MLIFYRHLDDLMQFLNEELNESLNINQIQKILIDFVHANIEPVLEFFLHSVSHELLNNHIEGLKSKIDREDERCIVKYIQIARERKPHQYNILQELILGSLISLVFSFDMPSVIKDKEFEGCQVFLDSNILFSLLGVHFKEFSEPAKESFDLLKKYCFKIKVFDFTVDEVTRVLNKCRKERREYPPGMRVNSICANLKKQNWTKQDIEIFISNIEDKLADLGVKIEPTDIDIGKYAPRDGNVRSVMRKYKPDQPPVSQNHDIAAIEKIKEIRKRNIRKIEDSKALFLTSDGKLSKYNFIEMGHREAGTVCEVVLDRFLTSILWLKHPEVELSLETLIAACYRDVFINVRIWERFYDTLQELKQSEAISEKDISSLLWQDYVEDVLCNLDENETDMITQEFILEETKKVKEVTQIVDKKTKETEERIEKQQREVNELNKKIDELSKERDDKNEKTKETEERIEKQQREVTELNKKMDELSKERDDKNKIQIENIKSNAKQSATQHSYVISFGISLILFIISYIIYSKRNIHEFPDIITYGLMLFVGGGGIFETWAKIRGYIENKLSDRYCRKKMAEMGLHEIEMKE